MAKKKKIKGQNTGGDMLRMTSMIAALGFIDGKDMAEQNAWKKRFLKLCPGIDFPDDFDLLSDEEKQRRLDGAIKIGLEKR